MAFQDLIDTASQIYGIFTQPRETAAPIQYGPTASQDAISTSTQYQQPPFEPPTDRAPIFQSSGPVMPGMFPKPGTMPQQVQPQQQAIQQQFQPQQQAIQQQFQPPVPGGVTIGQVPQQQAISPTDLDQPQIPRFDPSKTFDRILGVETGGRHRDQQGNIMTSSKGALGIAQIMPSTAARPGYGIKPLIGDEINDETKNREFGRSYFNAMVNQFGGDVEKGVAAYNAGEGGVKRAMAQAAQVGQPQNWKRFLPNETQAYLGKVLGPLAAEQRQAQAQPAPQVQQAMQPQAMPQAQPAPQVQQAMPQAQAAPAALPGIPNPQQMEQFDAVMRSNNPDTMIAFMDKAEPWQRMLLQNQIADTVQLNREKERAKMAAMTAVSSGDSRQLERSLKDKSIGHLVLGYIAGLIGGPELGREVAGQGGWFNSYTTTDIDGQQVSMRLSPSGQPLQGVYTTGPLQGTEVPINELRKTYGQVSAPGAKGLYKPEIGRTYVQLDDTGKVVSRGREVTVFRGNKAESYIDLGGGKRAPLNDPRFILETEFNAQQKGERGVSEALRIKHGANVLAAEKEVKEEYGPFGSARNPYPTREAFLKSYGYAEALKPGSEQRRAIETTPEVKSALSIADMKSQRETRDSINKKMGDTAAKDYSEKSTAMIENLNKAERGLRSLQEDKHYFGGGSNYAAYKAQQLLPFVEQDSKYRATQEILQLGAIENLERIGREIKPLSNADLTYVTRFGITERSTPEEIKTWLERYAKAEKFAHDQLVKRLENPSAIPQRLGEQQGQTQTQEQRVGKYNPKTGKVEY